MTSSAHALGSVLAAGPGFQAPGLEAFYPHPIFTFSIGGLDFAITRITVALWFATLVVIGFLIATVRRPSSVAARNTRMAISLRLATSSFLGRSGWVTKFIIGGAYDNKIRA